MKKKYLVNIVLPQKGNSLTAENYRKVLAKAGYNFYQQIGSLGGSSNAGIVSISNSVVTRK